MKNILLIIDPQIDFISGSLAVEGADEKMLKLSKYIKEKCNEYNYIFLTGDSHPDNHCSFIENGGIWPKHCICGNEGENFYDKLINSLLEFDDFHNLNTFYKGTNSDKEEYSIFQNELNGLELANKIKNIIENDNDTFIDVCGIAGDYCVLETIKGLTELINNDHIYILEEFTASIDGGKKLLEYAENNDINIIYKSTLNLEEYKNN